MLYDFSKRFKNKKIQISSQNCYEKDNYGAFTGNVSPFMIKKLGIRYVIIGHSENRIIENNKIIQEKIKLALKNKLKIIFCIGENKKQKKQKKTFIVLKKQILSGLSKNYNLKNIIFAYEPVWSIGTGLTPSVKLLKKM